jgi:hypothetical protein
VGTSATRVPLTETVPSGRDPWRKKVEEAVSGKDAISTAVLLDLLRVPATTGTARRLATGGKPYPLPGC